MGLILSTWHPYITRFRLSKAWCKSRKKSWWLSPHFIVFLTKVNDKILILRNGESDVPTSYVNILKENSLYLQFNMYPHDTLNYFYSYYQQPIRINSEAQLQIEMSVIFKVSLTFDYWAIKICTLNNMCCRAVRSHFSRVRLFASLWTVACQAPLSMVFSRLEYWTGFPCPPSGDLPNPGIKLVSLKSPALVR